MCMFLSKEVFGSKINKTFSPCSYLSVTGRTYGRPINGQLEVVGFSSPSNSQWRAAEGLFIHPSDFHAKAHSHAHTEL